MDQKYQKTIYRRQADLIDSNDQIIESARQKVQLFKNYSYFEDITTFETKQSLSFNHKTHQEILDLPQITQKCTFRTHHQLDWKNTKNDNYLKNPSNIQYNMQKESNQANYEQFSFRIYKKDNKNQTAFQQIGESYIKAKYNQNVYPKILELKESNKKLYHQCILLKKQLIKFQRHKQFIFDDFQKKVAKKLIIVIQKQRKQKERMSQALKQMKKQIDSLKTNQFLLASERQQCKQELQDSLHSMKKLQLQIIKLKQENHSLMHQNEDYFNQICQLQNIKIVHQQTLKHNNQLKSFLKRSQSFIHNLQNKVHQQSINQQQIISKEKDRIYQRIQLQEKIRNNQDKLYFYNALNEKTEEKLSQLVEFYQNSNINLCQQQSIVLQKISKLAQMIKQIKNTIFDFIEQNKYFFDFSSQQIKDIISISQKCNKSYQNISKLTKYEKNSKYLKKYLSNKQLKQSIGTTRTSQSNLHRQIIYESIICPQNDNQILNKKQQIQGAKDIHWNEKYQSK